MRIDQSILKCVLLPLIALGAIGCRSNSQSSTKESLSNSQSSTKESLSNSQSSTKESLSNGAIIDQLETGDDYRVEEFKTAFLMMRKPILSSADIIYSDYQNIMPHDYFDRYHIGAFRVKATIGGDDSYMYYIMYNQKLHDFSHIFPKANNKLWASFLFSDINHDGYIELTTAFFICGRLTVTYLSTLDTMNETYIRSLDHAYNSFLFFKEKDDNYQTYSKQVINGEIQEVESLYSDIIPYTRSYSLNQDEYNLKSDNYRVIVKKDESQTSIVPLIYRGLAMRFAIKTSMTWLGETFTYTNGSTYLDGALANFKQADKKLNMEPWPEAQMITNFTILKNQVIDCTYYYLDEYDNYNPLGNYDMEISYREEIITEKSALTITE